MAIVFTEEQFRCIFCQDIFHNPVSIPCGHNYCLRCIKRYWKTSNKPDCPLCKEVFLRCPELRVNVGLKDITEQFKRSLRIKAENRPVPAKRRMSKGVSMDDVLCDVCVEYKALAEKKCLVCNMSYCRVHLTPHLTDPGLKAHRMIDVSNNAAASTQQCSNHNQPLSMFCKKDQTAVCVKCAESEHKQHNVVNVDVESSKVKIQVKKSQVEVKHLITARMKKTEEIKSSVQAAKLNKEKKTAMSVSIYEAVLNALDRNQAVLVDEMEQEQEEVEKKAEELLCEMDQEITKLQKRRSQLQQLEDMENALRLVQGFSSLQGLPPTRDWSDVKILPHLYTGSIRGSLTKLISFCHDLEKELTAEEISKNSQFAVDVTLDPQTAAAWLVLSADGKKVSLGSQPRKVPDDPRRFDSCVSVLGRQSFTEGKHYWVVQVADKTAWDLGVARESINRKGAIMVRPDMGYWAICRRKGGSLSACAGPSVTLHLQEVVQKVGVFLDYEEGLVSFYDTETSAHIYTYKGCDFTEPVYPYLNPCLLDDGRNIAPLVICDVSAELTGEIAAL